MKKRFSAGNVRGPRFLPLNAFPPRTHLFIFGSLVLAISGFLPDLISLLLPPATCLVALLGHRLSRADQSSSG